MAEAKRGSVAAYRDQFGIIQPLCQTCAVSRDVGSYPLQDKATKIRTEAKRSKSICLKLYLYHYFYHKADARRRSNGLKLQKFMFRKEKAGKVMDE